MTTYFKAVRPDGTDFHTGTVQWAPPPGHEGEWIVRHPTATIIGGSASEYLSVSTVVTDCKGMKWPCRLLTVEAAGCVTKPSPAILPNRRAGVAFRVTGELPAHEALGPQCVHVVALLERARRLTPGEVSARDAALDAAWDAARDAAEDDAWVAARDAAEDATLDAAWDAARDAALDAAWDAALDAAWDDAWDAARDAAGALVVRDVITTDHYDTLTRAWRTTIGPIHPDDPELPPRARGDNSLTVPHG